ncbi:MAG TPA: TIGR03767 family metallophosphoesterase [Acidimicrobiales bacterium]|jgi:metallophosphoesterase (TIGR03767 family)
MDRRGFLQRGGGAALGLWLPRSFGLPAHDPPGRPDGTTLQATVLRPDGPGYTRLSDGPGWPTVVRTDLASRRRAGTDRRRSLAAFAHLTDLHLIDAQSPTRVEFIDPIGEPFTAAFRPQETLTLHVAASMIRRINALRRGPITGRRLDCAVSTGDNIDNQQYNEAVWFRTLLDGGRLKADSGARGAYEGVQEPAGATPDNDWIYWHPDGGVRDRWKDELGYPDVPGLLDAAVAPFTSPGLHMRWYSTYGNHDGLIQGVIPSTAAVERVLVDEWKMIGLPPGMDVGAFLVGVIQAEPDDLLRKLSTGELPARKVTPDPQRRIITAREWVQLHLDSPRRPGPRGHGYTEDHLESPALHYEFEISPGIVGLSLDTGGYYSGSLGEDQVAWLNERLAAHSSRWFDEAGAVTTGDNDDALIMVFSHFNWRSMDSAIPHPDRPGERRVFGPEVVALLHRFPNVVAWVNGHHHVNRVEPLPDPSGRSGGFWDINTASHVDYPQHARIVELADNGDGTLSIFCTMIEHAASPRADYDDTSVLGLAALSRELSANDPQSDLAGRRGQAKDLNVELVLEAPFDLAAAGI